MIEQASSRSDSSVDEVIALPMRVFEVEYFDGAKATYSAHFYDTSSGQCVFMDQIRVQNRDVLYYRRTIAAGQWRQVTEVTGATQDTRVN